MSWKSIGRGFLKSWGVPQSTVTGLIPISRPGDQGANQGNYNTIQQEQGALTDLQTSLPNIPQTLRTGYEADARRAGTWGDTPAFQQALNSEVQAGARGARVDNLARQGALRTRLGMEPLPPEQSGDLSTDANQQGIANQNATAAQTATNVQNASGGTMPSQPQAATPAGGINPMAIGVNPSESNNAVTQRQNAIGGRANGNPFKPSQQRGGAIQRKLGGGL